VGIVDWYLVGLAAGLGMAAGAAVVWALAGGRTRTVAAAAAAAAVSGGVAVAVLATGWAGVALAAGVAVSFVSLRRLSVEALPAALAGSVILAVVPALGYLLVLAAPLLGQRLGRRAGSRHAGLRILAKD
jgi:hypothetical protein